MKSLWHVLASLVSLGVFVPFGLAQESPADSHKAANGGRRDEVQRVAESMGFYILTEGQREPVQLVERPVLRYADTPRTDRDGAVWAVGSGGRPLAMMVVYTKSSFPKGHWIQAVTSLSPSNTLRGTNRDRVNWSSLRPGVVMKPFPEAPGVAETAGRRLTQLRQLARRFSGHEFWPADSRHELRLLVQPLYRYQDPQSGIIDGAVFALAHDTNPEVFLLIEASDGASSAAWQYGIARFGFAELHVNLDNEEVWTREIISSTGPTEPYWLFHLSM